MTQYLDKRNILNIHSTLFVDVELSAHVKRNPSWNWRKEIWRSLV